MAVTSYCDPVFLFLLFVFFCIFSLSLFLISSSCVFIGPRAICLSLYFDLMFIGLHHLDSWIKIDQPDVTCFIISLFTAHHVSNVSTSIFRSLRLIVDLFLVLYCSVSIEVLALASLFSGEWFETCWSVNSEIIKQVTSSWSIFI